MSALTWPWPVHDWPYLAIAGVIIGAALGAWITRR